MSENGPETLGQVPDNVRTHRADEWKRLLAGQGHGTIHSGVAAARDRHEPRKATLEEVCHARLKEAALFWREILQSMDDLFIERVA